MKYSVSWLNELAGTNLSASDMAELFVKHSFEVDGVEKIGGVPEGVVVGKILEVSPHPNADKLQCTKVTIDPKEEEVLDIVCGAKNIAPGDVVPVATIGTKLGEGFEIKKSKIRGEVSEGMLCAEDELGLGKDHGGILQLGKETPIGSPLSDIYGKGDWVIDLDILASRGRDALSHVGIARELRAIVKSKKKKENIDAKYQIANSLHSIAENIHISIKDSNLCKRYMGVLLENVDNTAKTPEWMTARLRSCGMKNVNVATDITNYVMLETGQPMHAFDFEKIKGESPTFSLGVRHAKAGEKLTLLDGKELKLDEKDIVIAGEGGALALAGVMGGKASVTSSETTQIFLESAWFDPVLIRKTRIRHKLVTESAYRFERDVDPEGVSPASARAVELLAEYAGARVVGMRDEYLEKEKAVSVKVPLAEVKSLLGVEIPLQEIREILERLSFLVEEKGEYFVVSVPSFRKDIRTQEDIIEEIGRVYGYDRVEPQALMATVEVPEKSPMHDMILRMKTWFTDWGWDEVLTYSFYGEEVMQEFALEKEKHFSLENPLSPELAFFRVSLLPHVLGVVGENSRRFDDVRVFEVGKVYEKGENGEVREKRECVVALSKNKEKMSFLEAKGFVSAFLERLLGESGTYEEMNERHAKTFLHPTQSARIFVSHEEVGYIGMIHPFFAKKKRLPRKTIVVAFSIDTLVALQEEQLHCTYAHLDRFPWVSRDISLEITKTLPAGEIEACIRESAGEYLRSLELFDVYEKESAKKLAYHLAFGSNDHTLSGKEVDEIRETLFVALEQKYGAKIMR
jgi:phenylalanyl-tRNA synthetase beta chain